MKDTKAALAYLIDNTSSNINPNGSINSSVQTNQSAPNSLGVNGNVVNNLRRVPFNPREHLEAFGGDFDVKSIIYNIESIQTFRADCRYKKARK